MALLVPDSLNAFPSDEKTDTTYPSQIDRKRLKGLIITESALYASTFVGLYSLWYKDFPQSKFHFFDDNKDWELVDKIGHATAAFCVGQIGYGSLRWAGVDKGKAMAYGSSIGFLYLTTVEVFDGFSKDWGASTGDLIANTAGTAFLIGQQLLWDEPRIMMKWSAHHTKYAQYRPDLLGSNWSERVMKDYNGHTYWLSGNIHSFLPSHNNFPKWLNIAVGYGAEGMTGPSQNSKSYNGETLPEFERRRQFYLAPDIDLSRIETNSQFLQVIFNTFGFLKIPLPTLEFSKKGVRFHPLYF
ncbi:MAG: YfiM family protein [Bacteroidales bacterium]|nr:YfiM family protein [Bacteroidales bacterium]